jgi:hypothetical protein
MDPKNYWAEMSTIAWFSSLSRLMVPDISPIMVFGSEISPPVTKKEKWGRNGRELTVTLMVVNSPTFSL